LTELKVGMLALISIVAIVFMSLKITTNQSGFGDYVSYKTVVSDAAGIFPKTPIKVAGINSGRIKSIQLNGNQAFIDFEILERVKVTKDSILKIKTIGFLGDKYLEVYVGENRERLPEGSLIPSETGGGMEDLTKDASEILKDLKAVMNSVRVSIAPENKESPLNKIVENVVRLSEDMKEVTGSLKRVMSTNEGRFNEIIGNIEKITSSLDFQLNASYQDSLMSDLKKIGPILDNAKLMTEDLKIMMADLKAGKGTIGRLMRDDEVIDQVSSTLAGVQKLVNKVEAIQTQLSMYTSVNSELGNRTEIALTLFPSPERFYVLGLSTSEIGVEKERQITEISDGGRESSITRKEVNKNSYRFNVQLGRKIHNWALRAGIIESTGGIGIDYHFPSFSSLLTMELFDYRKEIGPNLRLVSEIHFWNVLYGKLSFEDLVSKNDEQSLTIGAGLRFTDEDLKGLIGFFL
jgi:phospholipid/cholesterol/gamma-HCH transport system substrate-binding protein